MTLALAVAETAFQQLQIARGLMTVSDIAQQVTILEHLTQAINISCSDTDLHLDELVRFQDEIVTAATTLGRGETYRLSTNDLQELAHLAVRLANVGSSR